jgi:hypothetical protein
MQAGFHIPDFPTDFLGQQIKLEDIICYPTGVNSCLMVLAKVAKIQDIRSKCSIRTVNGEDFWDCRGWNGMLGPVFFKLVVERIQEGAYPAPPGQKLVTVDQLHRVLVVGRQGILPEY